MPRQVPLDPYFGAEISTVRNEGRSGLDPYLGLILQNAGVVSMPSQI
jgi:hypothetical protein